MSVTHFGKFTIYNDSYGRTAHRARVYRDAFRRCGNRRKAGVEHGLFTGNRENPWYVAALAMVGAAMSGITFVSVPGSVAADSFSYLQMVLGFTVGQMVIAFVLIPLFYRLKVVSLYEYLDGRFGMTTHLTGAWFFFISKMFAAALKVYVVCTVLQVLVFDPFGVPFAVNAAFLVGLVWLYTWRGGVRSVVWTDILHTCCLVGSIVLCIVFIMRSLGLTSAGVVQAVCDSPMSRIFFFEDAGSARYFGKCFSEVSSRWSL